MDVNRLFTDYKQNLYKRVDHELMILLLEQWFFCVIGTLIAASLSKVYIALVAGGLICGLPLYFINAKPGRALGRHIVAAAQMCFSLLVIYLLNGIPEARIHVFISLAILASYRDWKILITASLVTIAGHFFAGLYFPMEFYSSSTGVDMKWLYHAGWVLFELGALITSCVRATKEMRIVAESQFSLVQSRLEAENSTHRRTQFFSVVSHEIRTPLNGIIGFTDILRDTTITPEQREYVDIIKQCSDSLLKVLNDLLDFTKMDQGRLEIDPHVFKSRDIADYLETVFTHPCQKKNLRFTVDIEKTIPAELFGDSHRLRQILTNIISNAIKFTDVGEIQVRFSKSQTSGHYVWEVSDTGVGIKEDYLPKIFSPFTQENSGIARSHGGTGLGLAISKKLTELMGGSIEVQSTLGKGTRFIVAIPFSAVPKDAAAAR